MPYAEIPLLPGNCYHIFNHANGFENLFVNEGNYGFFLRKYALHIHPVAETFAYCLMPNHFHLCVRLRNEAELNTYFSTREKDALLPESFQLSESLLTRRLSRCFANLFSSYTQAFNKQQNRRGGLFISNFKRKVVDDDTYFIRLIRYIHYNPVHHGFVLHPAEYVHSSFMSLLSGKKTLLSRTEVMAFFGGHDGFLEAHQLQPDDAVIRLAGDWL